MNIEDQIEQIARTVVLQELEKHRRPERDEGTQEISRKRECIKAKESLSVNEAAFLLGCSDQHLRNLTYKARDANTSHPIPFYDLDGPIMFPLNELLEWARVTKPKAAKLSGNQKKKKTRLQPAA